VDADGLFARAKPLEACGRRMLRLDENDAVAHLLVHHVQHYFDRRLKWALDLGERVRQPGFDWSVVAERLRAWGGLGAAGLSVLHLRKLFPDLVPAAASDAIPAAAWRLALASPLRSRHPLDYFRGTRERWVQLYLAAAALERPSDLPGYLLHRERRDSMR
jgi:putative nucleotidyltransferase-like protein